MAIPSPTQVPAVKLSTLYKAVDYKTGKVIKDQDFHDPRQPFNTYFGVGEVVGAWEKGMVGMRAGGVRELIAPASLAYGEGAVVWVVHLLKVRKAHIQAASSRRRGSPEGRRASQSSRAKAPKQSRQTLTVPRQSGPPPKHIEIIDLRKGTGAAVTKGDSVYARSYVATYPELLKRSRSGLYGPRWSNLDGAVKGWAVGLPGMRVGGRRELRLPPWLVYPRWRKSWGYAPYVDVYVVELLGVKPSS